MKGLSSRLLWRMAVLLTLLLSAHEVLAVRLPFELSSFPIDQNLHGQSVRFFVSGDILLSDESGTASAQLSILVDMSDLQPKIAPIVQALGNRDEECGDKLRLHTVALSPASPLAEIFIAGHYERWGCIHAFGGTGKTRLFEQSASAKIRLIPRIEEGQTIALQFEVTDLSADGLLRSFLEDNVLGPPLRKALIDALRPALGSPLRVSLPEALRGYRPVFNQVQFVDIGGGKLGLKVDGRLDLTADQIQELLTGLASR